jgi:hypothetical protein
MSFRQTMLGMAAVSHAELIPLVAQSVAHKLFGDRCPPPLTARNPAVAGFLEKPTPGFEPARAHALDLGRLLDLGQEGRRRVFAADADALALNKVKPLRVVDLRADVSLAKHLDGDLAKALPAKLLAQVLDRKLWRQAQHLVHPPQQAFGAREVVVDLVDDRVNDSD